MREKIVLGTSIAPVNIEQQLVCIQSWIDNGFYVISCNTCEEIEILKPICSEIEIDFEEVRCELDDLRTKKLPFIHDILMAVYKRTNCIGGFANSDIYMESISQDFYEYIYQVTVNSLLIVRRYEINAISDIKNLNWKIHFDGIDMFLIDKQFIPNFFNDGFFVQSCWDSSILLKAKMQGIQIKELMNPVAFHKTHSQKWDSRTSNILAKNFWNKYYHTREHAFENLIKSYYDILLEDCKQVCFLGNKKIKCLFVLEKENFSIKKDIKGQECIDCTIAIQGWEEEEDYDYIFYVFKDIRLSPVFCKTIIYIMLNYNCLQLELREFYVTRINGEFHYSNFNKSIDLLEDVHRKSRSGILVKGKKNGRLRRKLILPIVYKEVDINNTDVFRKFKIKGTYYIAPAGIRANRWYEENGYKLHDMEFLGFLDNNKTGRVEHGNILAMEILADDQEAYVIVASKYYVREIMEQVSTITNACKVINAGLICHIDEDGFIYYFDLT